MLNHKKQENMQQSSTSHPLSLEASFSDPKAFVAHLREEIRQATHVVMEEIMCEELTHFVGAQWGESTPTRTGYRNGYFTRDLQRVCRKASIRDDREPSGQPSVYSSPGK